MGNTCHPASCCGGGDAFEDEQNTIERPLSTEGSMQENVGRGRDISTEEERRSNDTRDAEGRGGNTLIYEEEERIGNYNLEMPDPIQIAYENGGSFEGIEKEDCRNSEKKKEVFSAKSLVPEWEEEEEYKEKKREDYVQEGVRDLEEFDNLYKERNCRMTGEKEKRRENYEEEERHNLKINNIIDGRMYKENKQYEIEDRICSQGSKLYEMEEIIYSEENQNYFSISPYQNHFSPNMQRKEYWITEEPLAIRTQDIELFWDPLFKNPYDKAEETKTEEEEEEIQLSMSPFPKYLENYNTFATTTTTTTAVSTATSLAGLHGVPAARDVCNVSLGKSVSVDRDGIAIEAFGFKAAIGINPSITFFGQCLSLQRLLSGPDNPREAQAT